MYFAEQLLSLTIPPPVEVELEALERYEQRGYLGQLDYVGTRSVITLDPGQDFHLYVRRKGWVIRIDPPPALRPGLVELAEAMDDLPIVLDGVLLRGPQAPFIVQDVYAVQGESLLESSFIDRYVALDEMLGCPPEFEDSTRRNIALLCRDYLWVAPVFTFHFAAELRRRASNSEVAGLLLRHPDRVVDFKSRLRCAATPSPHARDKETHHDAR
jgi:hypothetical protein